MLVRLRIFYKSGGYDEVLVEMENFRLTSDMLEVKVLNERGMCAP